MRRAFTTLAALAALVSGAAVMQLKLAVQDQADQVKAIAAQIHNDRENIRVLNAEWAYLTSPHALQEKSIQFLALMPPSPQQVVTSIDEIPFRRAGDAVEGDDNVLLPSALKNEESKKGTHAQSKDRVL